MNKAVYDPKYSDERMKMRTFIYTRTTTFLMKAKDQEEAEAYANNGCECYDATIVTSKTDDFIMEVEDV